MLDLFHTELVKIIRDYLLEGTESKEVIMTEPYELLGAKRLQYAFYLRSPPFDYYVATQVKVHSSKLMMLILRGAKKCLTRS
jgi:hypothetical protein